MKRAAAMDGLLVFDGAVTAVCSRFTNNTGSGVFVSSSGQLTVQISSWALMGNGNATGPAGIGPGSGDAALGNVLFAPWLDEDACTTVSYQLYLPYVLTP
ncbi:MAG: hypothetical protein IPM53_05610 [Anaerolineaceae bacterium]|nr:hypothetical protein [Anaerolineaceae bacterium]